MIWDDFISFAGDTAEEPSEASQRSAISRAYYGAFNLSRRWVEAHVEPIENRAAHKQVWRAFKRPERASEGTRLKWKLVGDLGDTMKTVEDVLNKRYETSAGKARLAKDMVDTGAIAEKEAERKALEQNALAEFLASQGIAAAPTADAAPPAAKDLGPAAQTEGPKTIG